MALGHLATSFLVVACVLFRAPDISQVHLEPDSIRLEFPEQRAREELSCSPCSSVAWACEPSCEELLHLHKLPIGGLAGLLLTFLVGARQKVRRADRFVQVDFGPRELERFSLTPRSTMAGLYLVERSGSFDEVFVCGETQEGIWLCKCQQLERGSLVFRWVLIDMVPGHFRPVLDQTVERSAEVEAGGVLVKYLMAQDSEGDLQTKWDPEDRDGIEQITAWVAEAEQICRRPMTDYDHFAAGSRAAKMPEFKRKAGRRPAVSASMGTPGGGGFLPPGARTLPRPALPLVPRGAGTGLGDAGDAEDDDEDPEDRARMLEAQNTKLEMALKALSRGKAVKRVKKKSRSRSSGKSSSSTGGEGDKEKDKKKKKSSKKKKKKRKKSGSSSSSASSSSSGDKPKFVAWRRKGKNSRVTYANFARVDTMKFKRRADLLAFADKHPGVLAAHFLNGVRHKQGRGNVTETKDLRSVAAADWVVSSGQLKEVRDIREATTLATVLDHLNGDRTSQAVDTIAMRIVAMTRAKGKDGSWEKASRMELISDANEALGPSGVIGLV